MLRSGEAVKSPFRHGLVLYEKMLELSSEDDGFTVYRGSLTQLFDATGFSRAYYTDVFQRLEDCGSIAKLQRGGRNADTVIVLRQAPTLESWNGTPTATSHLTPRGPSAILEQQVRDLVQLLGGMNIVQALGELQGQIANLNSRVNQLEQKEN